jgi:5'-deoxynucleotidase YfbR-like HD superfamily hydrolase
MTLPQSPTYNIDRIIKICLIHDLAECIVGDITPHCGVSIEDKHQREAKVTYVRGCVVTNTLLVGNDGNIDATA